jgi:hypothetical protein
MKSGDYKHVFFLPVPDEGGRARLLGVELPALERALEDLGASVDRAPEEGASYDLVVAEPPETGRAAGAFLDRLNGLLAEGGFAAVLARRGIRRPKPRGLAAAGAYASIPGPRTPSVVVPVSDARPLSFLLSRFPDFSSARQAVRRAARLIVRLGFQKPLFKHLVHIFRREGAGVREPGMLAAVRDAATKALGAPSLAVSIVTRVEVETPAVLYFFFEPGRRDPSIVAKAASGPGRNDELRRERDNLESVHALLEGPLQRSVPAVRGSGEWRGRFYYLQDFAGGRMLPPSLDAGPLGLGRGRAAADLDRAWDWLLRFQSATAAGSRRIADLGIRDAIARYRDAYGDGEDDRRCLAWISAELERHGGRNAPLCASHGDLFPGNVLLGESGVAVVDWRYFRRAHHACFDVMTLVSTLGATGGTDGVERVFAGPHWANAFFRERFGAFLAANGLGADLFVFLSAAALLEMSVREHAETGRSGEKDAAWRRRLVRFLDIKDRIAVASARRADPWERSDR